MKNVLLIGCGQVGSAIKQIEEEAGNKVYITEIDTYPPVEIEYDVCHINIPCKNKDMFIKTVSSYLNNYIIKDVVIINSTVPPFTTKELSKKINVPIVHSFVRGVHPNLYEGIKIFEKPVGGTSKAVELACEHLNSIGITTYNVGKAINSELGKILSTTYYGWNILFCKEIKKICDEIGADFDVAYMWANKTYNEGYTKLKMEHVVRPILYPPKGKVGGHCVSENFELLPESKIKKIAKELNEE